MSSNTTDLITKTKQNRMNTIEKAYKEKLNNQESSQLRIGGVSSRLISEEILNDKQLQELHAERAKIYSLSTQTVILKENGETVWTYENNHLNLANIDELIQHRTEHIKNFYS